MDKEKNKTKNPFSLPSCTQIEQIYAAMAL